jgi:hypothetical protein
MSNALAVATVTATLQSVLDGALADAALAFPQGVQGAKVFVGHPGTTHGGVTAGADLLLYRVTPDPNHRNADLATRGPGGELVQPPVAAVSLRYLIACFGDESKQEPEQVLGTVAAFLHAFPTITPAMIAAATASGQFPFLTDADLARQIPPVRLTEITVTDEDLFRIWSMLPSDQLAPTLVYDANVVLLEQPSVTTAPFPVLTRGGALAPLRQPRILSIVRHGQPRLAPIRAGDVLDVAGQLLAASATTLDVDGIVVPGAAITVATDSLIRFTLPATTPAGARTLRVAHVIGGGPPPATIFTTTSEPAVIMVHPVISAAAKVAGNVEVTVATAVGAGQRAEILVNRLGTAHSAVLSTALATPTKAVGAAAGVAPGIYLVRIRVDGVESIPAVGGSGVIDTPQVTL